MERGRHVSQVAIGVNGRIESLLVDSSNSSDTPTRPDQRDKTTRGKRMAEANMSLA